MRTLKLGRRPYAETEAAMRAFTVTTTKLMLNMMWATVMVRKPRLPSCCAATKATSPS